MGCLGNDVDKKREIEKIYVFDTAFDFKKEKPDYTFTFKGDNEETKYFTKRANPEIINFWRNFHKDNFFNPVNKYLDEKLKAYNEYLESLKFDSIDCRMIKTILY